MDWLYVAILALLLIVFGNLGKGEVEKFCEQNELPDGRKLNISTYSKWALISGFVVLLIIYVLSGNFTLAFGFLLITLVAVCWVGPYVHFAFAWKDKERPKK